MLKLALLCLSVSAFPSTLVRVEGINNNRGVLQLAVWKTPNGFPEDDRQALIRKTVSLDSVNAIEIKGLVPGFYAIAIFHDENEDVVLNRNFLGIPKEGFGFSRNPRIRVGPPKFEDASVEITGNDFLNIKIAYP